MVENGIFVKLEEVLRIHLRPQGLQRHDKPFEAVQALQFLSHHIIKGVDISLV